MATRRDLEMPIWRGDTFAFPLLFLDGGVPLSLEGKTLLFTLKVHADIPDDEAELIYEVTLPNPDPLAAAGKHTILLQPSQTQPLHLGAFIYQVQLTSPTTPNATVVTYVWGKALVKDS